MMKSTTRYDFRLSSKRCPTCENLRRLRARIEAALRNARNLYRAGVKAIDFAALQISKKNWSRLQLPGSSSATRFKLTRPVSTPRRAVFAWRRNVGERSHEMKDLAVIKRRTSSRISAGQTGLALLDATVTGTKAKDLEAKLHRLVIGQEEAIHEIVRTYQTYLAGLSPEGRPIGNFLFLGPRVPGRHAQWRRPPRPCSEIRGLSLRSIAASFSTVMKSPN